MDFVDFSKRKNQFGISDRVVWVNESNEPKTGTIRWLGLAKNCHMIGVEFESVSTTIPYDESFPRIEVERRFFSRPGTGRLITPELLTPYREYFGKLPQKPNLMSPTDFGKTRQSFQQLFTQAEKKIKENDVEQLASPTSSSISPSYPNINGDKKPELPPRKPTSKYKDLNNMKSMTLPKSNPKPLREPADQPIKVRVTEKFIDQNNNIKDIKKYQYISNTLPNPSKNRQITEEIVKIFEEPAKVSEQGPIISGILNGLNESKNISQEIRRNSENKVPPLPPKNKKRIYEMNLEWLKLGKVVSWKKDRSMKRIYGYIRWFGDHEGLFKIGIELEKPLGNSSGEGHLFTCDPHHGIFLPLRKILYDPAFELYLPTTGSYSPSEVDKMKTTVMQKQDSLPIDEFSKSEPKNDDKMMIEPKKDLHVSRNNSEELSLKLVNEFSKSEPKNDDKLMMEPEEQKVSRNDSVDLVHEFTGQPFIGQREVNKEIFKSEIVKVNGLPKVITSGLKDEIQLQLQLNNKTSKTDIKIPQKPFHQEVIQQPGPGQPGLPSSPSPLLSPLPSPKKEIINESLQDKPKPPIKPPLNRQKTTESYNSSPVLDHGVGQVKGQLPLPIPSPSPSPNNLEMIKTFLFEAKTEINKEIGVSGKDEKKNKMLNPGEVDEESDIELLFNSSTDDDEIEASTLNGALYSAADVLVQVPLKYATEVEVKDGDGDTIQIEQATEVTEADDLGPPPPIPSKNYNSRELPTDSNADFQYQFHDDYEDQVDFIRKDDENVSEKVLFANHLIERANEVIFNKSQSQDGGKRDYPGSGPISLPPLPYCEDDFVNVYDKGHEIWIKGLILPPPLDSERIRSSKLYRGIQGDKNSCYIDSVVFSLFTFSTRLDRMLEHQNRSSNLVDDALDRRNKISYALKDIVISLREELYSPFTKMEKLRSLLSHFDKNVVSGFLDVEEIFYILFRKAFNLEPFINLETGIGEFVFQIVLPDFVPKYSMILPTTQQLFELGIKDLRTKLACIPQDYLILQIPRKEGKLSQGKLIIPSFTLDISAFLNGVSKPCVLCGNEAEIECLSCFNLIARSSGSGMKSTFFCKPCEKIIHQHPDRKSHVKKNEIQKTRSITQWKSSQLDLMAIICFKDHHYTSYVKCDQSGTKWVYYDSAPYGRSKVQVTPNLSDQLISLRADDILDLNENWEHYPDDLKHILAYSYFLVYEPPHF